MNIWFVEKDWPGGKTRWMKNQLLLDPKQSARDSPLRWLVSATRKSWYEFLQIIVLPLEDSLHDYNGPMRLYLFSGSSNSSGLSEKLNHSIKINKQWRAEIHKFSYALRKSWCWAVLGCIMESDDIWTKNPVTYYAFKRRHNQPGIELAIFHGKLDVNWCSSNPRAVSMVIEW